MYIVDSSYEPVGKISKESIESKDIPTLRKRFEEIRLEPDYVHKILDPSYEELFTPAKRVKGFLLSALVVVGVIAAIAAFTLLCTGHLTTFAHDLVHTYITIKQCAIGGLVTLGLLGGSAIVIARAIHKKEVLLASTNQEKEGDELDEIDKPADRGNFAYMSGHIETAVTSYRDKSGKVVFEHVYIDTSTLDAKKNGKAFLYSIKDYDQHYICSALPFFGVPVVFVGSVVYNLFRAVIAPFYVLVQLIRQGCGDDKLFEKERRFHVADIGKAFIQSIWNVIKAPFYALALMMANLYALVNPMGGRKLVATIERDWNDGVTLNEGYWSVGLITGSGGKMPLFVDGWKSGPISLLKGLAFYLSGCQQPEAVMKCNNGKIVLCESMEKVVDPSNPKWRSLNVHTLTELKKNFKQEGYAELIKEKNMISDELEVRFYEKKIEKFEKESNKLTVELREVINKHNQLVEKKSLDKITRNLLSEYKKQYQVLIGKRNQLNTSKNKCEEAIDKIKTPNL